MEAAEFNRIAGKYIDVVYRTTLSYCKNKNDAEDAVQNTFLKLSGRRLMNVKICGNHFGIEMLLHSTN